MSEPRIWTLAEFKADVTTSRNVFRQQRLEEPLAHYSRFFEAFTPVFTDLIARLPDVVGEPLDADELIDWIADDDRRTAFRYLAAPPISEDDLKTLAETSLSPGALAGDATQARRVRDTVLHVLDPHRFPWIAEGRAPLVDERDRAVVASAALVAARKVETWRRSRAKGTQESAVKHRLEEIGLREVSPREIAMLDAAPAVGEFCGESRLGGTRADLVVRLYDGRAMPIECKVSNSAVNSFKRVNREAVGKAIAWLTGFGNRQVVPAAVISGVFSSTNLEAAQADGLSIYWGHRLDDLADFVLST